MLKILKIFAVLSILIFSIGLVSAADGTFTDLQTEINASSGILTLTKNYSLSSSDIGFYGGINITKDNFVLDGGNNVVNGNDQARIFYVTGKNVTIKNIILIGGNHNIGAAIANHGSDFKLIDSIIENNTGGVSSGAIHNTGNNAKISGTIINNNTAVYMGGGIYNTGNNFVIDGTTIITNNVLTNGISIAHGGAGIYNTGLNFLISGNVIISNNIAFNGGGIYNSGNNFKINGTTTIKENKVSGVGGGIYNIGNNFQISGITTINDNIAYQLGGGIHTNGNTFIINGTTIINNNSLTANHNENLGNGGGISVLGSNFIIDGTTTISENRASNGGGIYANVNGLTITGNTNVNNNYVFHGGGGIHLQGNNMIITGNTNIYNNTAGTIGITVHIGSGGGIISSHATNVTITGNTNINDNKATNAGGGIYNFNSNLTINGININNNIANYGEAIYNAGTLYSHNNILSGNATFLILNANTLYLNNNTMISNNIEKVYNSGTVISNIILTFNNNITIDANVDENLVFNATIVDDKGNVIVGQNVGFVIESNLNQNVSVFNSGYYLLSHTFNQAGVYILNGNYVGGTNVTVKSGIIKIIKIQTNNELHIPAEITIGDTVTIESILTDENGNAMVGETIEFFLNGQSIGTAVTDANGVAKITYTFNNDGDFIVTSEFSGTATHEGSTATNNTKIVKIETFITIIVEGDEITVILTDNNGNKLSNQIITLTMNGIVIGVGTTDENGIAKFFYENADKHSFTASFEGNDKYAASSATYNPAEDPVIPSPGPVQSQNTINVAEGTISMETTGNPLLVLVLLLFVMLAIPFRREK